MRIVVTGATGVVGSSLLRKLGTDPAVSATTGITRHAQGPAQTKLDWVRADVTSTDIADALAGADAVVHLAWSWDEDERAAWATNVTGTTHVLEAVRRAGIATVAVASSAVVYAPSPDGRPVAEDSPRIGQATTAFARHKTAVEVVLDHFEAYHPATRVVRLRPAAIVRGENAWDAANGLLSPLLAGRRSRKPEAGLRMQAVHAYDVAEAIRLAILNPMAHGPYNLAAPPAIDAALIKTALRRRTLGRRRARTIRDATRTDWEALAQATPLIATDRATADLGWSPTFSAHALLDELRDGLQASDPSRSTDG